MKRQASLIALTGSLMMGLLAHDAAAQVRVERVDADTIRVTEFQGKPPHRRQYINQAAHPELFAQYEARVGNEAQPLMAVDSRRGAPGKMTSLSRVRVSSDPQEVAEFARFEETKEPAREDSRRWFGAPGKGRSIR